VHWRGDELRRHVVDRAHALGVLRRERGDDRGAVDAERRERLEIGLDAGAAAGVRAGNGQSDRRHTESHSRFLILSSPRKRGPITTASGIWVPACAGTTADSVILNQLAGLSVITRPVARARGRPRRADPAPPPPP